jgi:hypothetical protein
MCCTVALASDKKMRWLAATPHKAWCVGFCVLAQALAVPVGGLVRLYSAAHVLFNCWALHSAKKQHKNLNCYCLFQGI